MKMNVYGKYLVANLVAVILFTSGLVAQNEAKRADKIETLKFLGKYELPNNLQYKGTTVGGLSGIHFDAKTGLYYMICDDRSEINPARFYTARIKFTQKGIDTVELVNVTTLKQADGSTYPSAKKDPANTIDPEAMRYNPATKSLVFTSEGERIIGKRNILNDPAIITITPNGKFIEKFAIPEQMKMTTSEKGPRKNGAFEGVTFAENFNKMYVSVEEPLYQDGSRAELTKNDAWARIIEYDMATKKPVAQYAYHLEPIARPPLFKAGFKVNGIADILQVNKNELLVVERSFSTGFTGCTIKVFLANLAGAGDIHKVASLKTNPPAKPVAKELLLDMDSLGIYIDNVEGVTFGPTLPNGHRTLLFVADDNFNAFGKTQFLLFEVNADQPKSRGVRK